MKNIHDLIPDIYQLLESKNEDWFDELLATQLSANIALRLREHFRSESSRIDKPTLRLSKMGPTCPKALWFSIHHPERAEPLPPWAKIKYAFGHILEALVICLAKAAGHEVTGEQDELVLDGIKGHRDCVVDGCIVDVKSCSSRSFAKFKDGSIVQDDSFGYLDQLDGYLVASADDPLVRIKDKAYILAIDKTLGHMVLYEHTVRENGIRHKIAKAKDVVGSPTPPECTCGTRQDGKSGNIALDTRASYSAFKHSCFPKLRTFLYADGPRYLVHVERKPDVTEIDKDGRIVYN